MLTINVVIHGLVMFSYFSQLIIEFINSLLPLKSGSISSIRDAGLHDFVLLASNNEATDVFRTLSNI